MVRVKGQLFARLEGLETKIDLIPPSEEELNKPFEYCLILITKLEAVCKGLKIAAIPEQEEEKIDWSKIEMNTLWDLDQRIVKRLNDLTDRVKELMKK